ncbi:MAG: DUF4157 domain-containing protein [Bradymonadales bacterium]|nr:DUF4157 domain-containing protein [Bradymonadales bacterium]
MGSPVQQLIEQVVGPNPSAVHQAAREGIQGPSTALPYLQQVQQSFGHHDVSQVQAHVGGAAQEASSSMGARAYAVGSHVAFRESPDLHTTAHEAAHVVQQRHGVSLADGVGRAGDRYEQHADAVANQVVKGEPAQALLDKVAPAGGLGGGGVQLVAAPGSKPATEPAGGQTSPTATTPASTPTYTVKPGDRTLWRVARKALGNPFRWQEIAALNGNPDPKSLTPGMVLKLPALEGKKDPGYLPKGGPTPPPDQSAIQDPSTAPDKSTPGAPDVSAPQTGEQPPAVKEGAPPQPNAQDGSLSLPPPTPNPGMSDAPLPEPVCRDENYALGTNPVISGPSSPQILNAPGPDMDYLIQDATGLTPGQHLQQIRTDYDQLVCTTETVKQDLVKESQTLQAGIETQAGMTTSTVTSTSTSNDQTLGSTFDTVLGEIKGKADAVLAQAEAKKLKARQQIETLSTTTTNQMNTAFLTAGNKLIQAKANWEGTVGKTVDEQIKSVLKIGAQYQQIAETAGNTAEQDAKTAGQQVDSSMAYDQAEFKSSAKIYKKYAPYFAKYAKLAADFLTAAKNQRKILATNLLAPSIESLDPLAKSNKAAIKKEMQKYTKKIDAEVNIHTNKTQAIKLREMMYLSQMKQETTQTLQKSQQDLTRQVTASKSNLQNHTTTVTTAFTRYRDRAIQSLDQTAASTPGLPDSKAITAARNELQREIQCDTQQQISVMQQDAQTAMMCIDEEADQRLAQQTDGVCSYQGDLQQGSSQTQDALQGGADQVCSEIDAGQQITASTITTVAGNVGQNSATESTNADTKSQDYATKVTNQLENYKQSVVSQLDSLKTKMTIAVNAGAKQARKAEKKDLHKRTDSAYHAIDGVGTDEAKLLKSLMAISRAEAEAIKEEYPGMAGESLRAAIIGDTSKGDNVRESCFAYLRGDPVAGAKYAMKYATDATFSNFFGADTDLLNSAVSTLDEEHRTKLLKDPEFPALKKQIEFRLAQEQSDPIFGANKYDVDTFKALTDKKLSHQDAHLKVEAIKLTKAFKGTNNPFTWGTDEAATWEILGKLEGEELERFKKFFKGYHGQTLEKALKSEMSGLEKKRGLALARGDKYAADMYGLEYALQKGKEKDAFKILEDPNLTNSKDWLAQKEANSKREKLIASWNSKFGRPGLTLEDSIRLRLKSEGANASDIGVALLKGQNAKVEHLLAYAIIGSGTEEEWALKAMRQLRDQLQGKSKKERIKEWQRICKWFKDNHGITNLEKYLGVGKYKYYPGGPGIELEGQERHDFSMLLMEALSEENNVPDMYRMAKANWEWYRGRGGGATGVTDLFTGSGKRLDHFWSQVQALYKDGSWYNAAGQANDKQSQQWKDYETACDRLNRMSDIYKGKREAIADAICTVLVTVAAVVSTVLTAGALAPVWAGVAITFSAAIVSMGIKAAIKGNAYSENDALKDFGSAIFDAILSLGTLGIGPAAKFKTLLDAIGDANAFRLIAKNLVSTFPGEVKGLLLNEKVWEDPKAFGEAFGWMALKWIGTSTTGAMTDKYVNQKIGGLGGEWMKMVIDTPLNIVLDQGEMTKDRDQIALGFLKTLAQNAVGLAGAQSARGYLIRKYNGQGALTQAQIDRLQGVDPDAYAKVYEGLNEKVKASIPPMARPEKYRPKEETTETPTPEQEPKPAEKTKETLTPEEKVRFEQLVNGFDPNNSTQKARRDALLGMDDDTKRQYMSMTDKKQRRLFLDQYMDAQGQASTKPTPAQEGDKPTDTAPSDKPKTGLTPEEQGKFDRLTSHLNPKNPQDKAKLKAIAGMDDETKRKFISLPLAKMRSRFLAEYTESQNLLAPQPPKNLTPQEQKRWDNLVGGFDVGTAEGKAKLDLLKQMTPTSQRQYMNLPSSKDRRTFLEQYKQALPVAKLVGDLVQTDYKKSPIRVDYEKEVEALKTKAQKLLAAKKGAKDADLEDIARELNQDRTNIGKKYKKETIEPLRDFIFYANTQRYDTEYGPSYEFLRDKKGKSNLKIIESSYKPNPDINEFLAPFNLWLTEQPLDKLKKYEKIVAKE